MEWIAHGLTLASEIQFEMYFRIRNLPEVHEHPRYADYAVDTDECLRGEQSYPDAVKKRRYSPHIHGTGRQSLPETYLQCQQRDAQYEGQDQELYNEVRCKKKDKELKEPSANREEEK